MMKATSGQMLILIQDHESWTGRTKVYVSRIVDNMCEFKIKNYTDWEPRFTLRMKTCMK